LTIDDIAVALNQALSEVDTCLVRVPLSWNPGLWPIRQPLDALGGDGGEGVGSGPGMTIGAALALRGSNRLAVAVLGDGDFAMGVNALWTAAHYELPLIIVVANNRSFFNDEVHQHRVAVARGRPTENRWIGQRIQGPDIDLAALARGQGLVAHGPVGDRAALADALASAVADARDGSPVVVDVRIASEVSTDAGRLAGRVERG
jgi:thiamine pyrophosphate-dependent acetolactate synthase large subunit-like protein